MATKKKKGAKDERFRDLAQNRRAFFEYEIVEKIEAGLVLVGSEVKGLRERGGTIADAYVMFSKGEAWLVNAHISDYANSGSAGHDPRRTRKLLLHRREIERLASRLAEKGLALIATRMYFKDGRAKIELGLGRGKTLYDKRRTIADRDSKRDLARVVKGGRR